MSLAGLANAASAESTAAYKAAKEKAAAEYEVSMTGCKSLVANPKAICHAQAEAQRTLTLSDAQAVFTGTLKARTHARIETADADYKVAKAKCGSRSGNDKDVCIKEAKAVNVSTIADAKRDLNVSTARTDARNDKDDANYKVALEKCDALMGAEKDRCVAAAKTQFKK